MEHAEQKIRQACAWSRGERQIKNYWGDQGKPLAPLFLVSSSESKQAVCVSACGNFGFAGSSTGVVHMWNMQSGARRKSFSLGPCPKGVSTKYRPPPGKQKSEERSVTGLATDSLNRVVIVSTLDGTVNVRARHMILQMVMKKFLQPVF
jgi:WD40 repeat protein